MSPLWRCSRYHFPPGEFGLVDVRPQLCIGRQLTVCPDVIAELQPDIEVRELHRMPPGQHPFPHSMLSLAVQNMIRICEETWRQEAVQRCERTSGAPEDSRRFESGEVLEGSAQLPLVE